jgi:hypothetical protein
VARTVRALAKGNSQRACPHVSENGRLRLALREIYHQPSEDAASWAIPSRLEPMKKVACRIEHHRDGILRWCTCQNPPTAQSRASKVSCGPPRPKRAATAYCAIPW